MSLSWYIKIFIEGCNISLFFFSKYKTRHDIITIINMMANDPGSAPPGSPRSPRTLRSRTNSPLMAGGRSFSPGIHADPTFLGLKDRVVGELASRIKKPMSSSSAGFNKNKQGKLSVYWAVDHQILKIFRYNTSSKSHKAIPTFQQSGCSSIRIALKCEYTFDISVLVLFCKS